jgi:hypothetical protein
MIGLHHHPFKLKLVEMLSDCYGKEDFTSLQGKNLAEISLFTQVNIRHLLKLTLFFAYFDYFDLGFMFIERHTVVALK